LNEDEISIWKESPYPKLISNQPIFTHDQKTGDKTDFHVNGMMIDILDNIVIYRCIKSCFLLKK